MRKPLLVLGVHLCEVLVEVSFLIQCSFATTPISLPQSSHRSTLKIAYLHISQKDSDPNHLSNLTATRLKDCLEVLAAHGRLLGDGPLD
jgi:hypothetical protein